MRGFGVAVSVWIAGREDKLRRAALYVAFSYSSFTRIPLPSWEGVCKAGAER